MRYQLRELPSRVTPPTNTRMYARIVGHTTDPVRFSKVPNIRTQAVAECHPVPAGPP